MMASTEPPLFQALATLGIETNDTGPTYNISSQNITETSNKVPNPKVFILLATMFASGVFGNILAIIVLARSSRDHKQTVFYRLVGALACTDLFGTCAVSPVTLLVYTQKITIIQGTALCNYSGFMFIFAGCATIFIIGAMAIDRYLAIRCPFTYEKHMRVGKAKYVIIGLWGFAAFMGCLPIVGLGEIVVQFPRTWCFFTFTSASITNKVFAYSYCAIGLLVISVTAISNVFVTLTLLKMRRKFRKTLNTCSTKRTDSELQMMVLLLGVVVIFSVCWCPFLIRIIINQVHEEQRDILADLNALKLASLNQILDPWVYILFRKELFMRWFFFLKSKVFGKCFDLCHEGREQTTALVNHRNGKDMCKSFARENGVIDNEYTQIQEHNDRPEFKRENSVNETEKLSKRCSNRSKSSERSKNISFGEDVPLREIDGKEYHGVHMKHSACLFCFANHSRHFAISSMGDSKSMNNLHSDLWSRDCPELEEMGSTDGKVKDTKRNLSFTDMRLEKMRKCETGEPCVTLECY